MRYALPISDGRVSPHFGHCEQFALIDVDEATRKIVNKELVIPPDHQPGVFPAWLAEEGANIIIAGGMGIRAQNLFSENRIEVIVGAVGDDPEVLVLAHLDGTLATGDNVCDH
ncbi:MAG: ATPase [Dehalococcoidia bacterium]|nr:ATPase [Dehalococcoidia bacterium]